MAGFLTLLGLFLAAPNLSSASLGLEISPLQFQSWFDAARKGKLLMSAEVRKRASWHRYVFVGGIHSEQMPGYFAQNARELRAKGIPVKLIHFIYPTSKKSVAENVAAVRAEFLEIAAKGPEKLVVIAHSRGACDALAFALQNPEFVSEHVRAMFLVQGPFGGTAVADYLAGEGRPMDRRMPLGQRVLAQALAQAEAWLFNEDKHLAIKALSRKSCRSYWEEVLKKHAAAIPIVHQKTFYVTSQTGPSRHSLFQKATAWYVGTYYGKNDGMVTIDDQVVPGVGAVAAVLDVGHTDLTHRFPSARPKRQFRKALVDAILMAVTEAQAAQDHRRSLTADLATPARETPSRTYP